MKHNTIDDIRDKVAQDTYTQHNDCPKHKACQTGSGIKSTTSGRHGSHWGNCNDRISPLNLRRVLLRQTDSNVWKNRI